MKLFLKHPRTGLPDVMGTLTVVVVIAAALKFLLDGVSLAVHGHTITFGHVDSLTYGSLTGPVLGAHGYLNSRDNTVNSLAGTTMVDNPDREEGN